MKNPSSQIKISSLILASALMAVGCTTTSEAPGRRSLATMKADQSATTPDQALELLRDGNVRFVSGKPVQRDVLHDQKITAAGQYPHSVILSCIDSRVPAETIFDTGLGDIFNARVAGNIADSDLVGSIEFACAVAGAKLVLVVGHSNCGAVKGACDGVQLGNLTGLLEKIRPAVAAVRDVPGEHNSKNHSFVEAVGELNVRQTEAQILEMSPVLRELQKAGKIKVAGCIYDLETGHVRFLSEVRP